MKQFFKITIVLVIVYLAYKYYIDNYTAKGISKKINDDEALFGAKSRQLKEAYLDSGYNNCNSLYSAGQYEWSDVSACKLMVDSNAASIDWIAKAKQS